MGLPPVQRALQRVEQRDSREPVQHHAAATLDHGLQGAVDGLAFASDHNAHLRFKFSRDDLHWGTLLFVSGPISG